VIYDVETGIPLYTKTLSANIHDSRVFGILFKHVRTKFNIADNAKFLADSAYDSTKIYGILRYYNITPVIATNGRGHYKSSKPKDKEYGKRWAIERFFSKIKRKLNLLNNRFFELEKVYHFM
jgi:transposase